jgi:addiction module HigA family antidote
MADIKATRSKTRRPTPPGKVLGEDVLPATGKTKTEIARLLGISRQSLYDILDCKQPITPQMAVRVGKLCGNGPAIWLAMQSKHDLWEAERSVDVSKIPTLEHV